MFVSSNRAFTLIEVLVVLFIIVFLFSIAFTQLFSNPEKINKAFEHIILLNRRVYTSSQIHRNTYRLALKRNSSAPDEYWVEKQEINPETGDKFFQIDDFFFSEPQKIHHLLVLEDIETSNSQEKTDPKEIFYIYYYPTGLSQSLALQFLRVDNQGRWTLYLDPITKEFQLLVNEKSLDSIKDQM